MLRKFVWSISLVLCLSLRAQADITLPAEGVVSNAWRPSGVWADVQVGDSVYMTFNVPDQGEVGWLGHIERYPYLPDTFVMAINGVTVRAGAQDQSIVVTHNEIPDHPRDNVLQEPPLLTLSEDGYGVVFLLQELTGTALGSATLADIPGTYPGELFTDQLWFVYAAGGSIKVDLSELVISPPGGP
jgi:hypothetical protein